MVPAAAGLSCIKIDRSVTLEPSIVCSSKHTADLGACSASPALSLLEQAGQHVSNMAVSNDRPVDTTCGGSVLGGAGVLRMQAQQVQLVNAHLAPPLAAASLLLHCRQLLIVHLVTTTCSGQAKSYGPIVSGALFGAGARYHVASKHMLHMLPPMSMVLHPLSTSSKGLYPAMLSCENAQPCRMVVLGGCCGLQFTHSAV